MQIHLETGDGVPIYLQIVNQVREQVASGRLTPGEEVPTIRALAFQLTVNPNTVARAYRDLERSGVLATRRGAGTIVADRAVERARLECRQELAGRVDRLVGEAKRVGVGLDELLGLVRERWTENQPWQIKQ